MQIFFNKLKTKPTTENRKKPTSYHIAKMSLVMRMNLDLQEAHF